jgi:hypothetical protein
LVAPAVALEGVGCVVGAATVGLGDEAMLRPVEIGLDAATPEQDPRVYERRLEAGPSQSDRKASSRSLRVMAADAALLEHLPQDGCAAATLAPSEDLVYFPQVEDPQVLRLVTCAP